MKCDKINTLLLDYFYNELDEINRKQFERHMQSCNDCKRAYKELSLTSTVLKKWAVPDPNLNIVFVAAKSTLTEKIKDALHAFSWLKRRPLRKIAYGFAAVLLILSFVNFEAVYDNETGSISISTSIFGKSSRTINDDFLMEQLLISQNQILEIMQENLIDQESRQVEQINKFFTNYMQNIEYQRQQDLDIVGSSLQKLYDFTDQSIEDTKDALYKDLLVAIRMDIKSEGEIKK